MTMIDPAGARPYLSEKGKTRLQQRLEGYLQQLRTLQAIVPSDVDTQEYADAAEHLETEDDISQLQGLVDRLRSLLARALPLSPGPDDGIVRQGCTVVVRDEAGGERGFQLLDGAEMEDDTAGAAVDLPIGRALLGRSAPDTVTVATPSGERLLTIVSVEQYRPEAD
jgi:transcription elongation GreA/GreB family factor